MERYETIEDVAQIRYTGGSYLKTNNKKDTTMPGPSLTFSDQLHAEKYRAPGESFREAMNRIASAMKDDDDHYYQFRDILLDMEFLPGGRVQAAMGATRQTTAFNCFVSGTIEDSFVDGEGSIMHRATQAAQTMRFGGGIGYGFSTLRPRKELIKTLQSGSSGPVSFMSIYNAVGLTVCSAGHRRGAQMGVMRVDHPDIVEFLHVKQNSHALTGFNISIGITDEFMRAVLDDTSFDLRWGNKVYETIQASALFEQIMRATWDWAEPGVIFLDTINKMNNLWYCEEIVATNPCGEQPLPPFGACLLGSFNLVKFIYKEHQGEWFQWKFNWDAFKESIPSVVRAMDNVIDRTTYPLPEQEEEAKSKRRMGLGITALANAAEVLGGMYGSHQFLEFEKKILTTLRDEAYRASIELAKEKGSFPLFDTELYCQGEFIKTLPEDIQADIKKFGIRNSHLLSIAPTGTISMTADNVSGAIEPVYKYLMERPIETIDGPRIITTEDYGYRVFGIKGKTAAEVTSQEHIAVLAVAAKLTDSAVSKTCNVSPDMPWEDFKNIYIEAWKLGCKGCTIFNEGGKRSALLVEKTAPTEDEVLEVFETVGVVEPSCRLDFETGRRECD